MAPVNHSKNQGADGVRTVSKCYPPPPSNIIFLLVIWEFHTIYLLHILPRLTFLPLCPYLTLPAPNQLHQVYFVLPIYILEHDQTPRGLKDNRVLSSWLPLCLAVHSAPPPARSHQL